MKLQRSSPIVRASLLLAPLLLHTTPFLRAATVFVDGTDGTNGASATLGGSGGNGGNGQSVTATADAAGDATNLATAKAGRGGSGGDGGGGSTGNPSFPPGFGGDGGNGGSATAIANTALSGAGGNALANAFATGDGGGGPGGRGGDYSPSKHGAAGFDSAFSATASAVTSTGSARAEANAYPNGYGGGTGFASATASNASSDGVDVRATAAGGSGRPSGQGSAGPGATATLGTVTGTSTGGGAVSVSAAIQGGLGGVTSVAGASGGAGGAASLVNAVSGSTSGALSLSQQVQAGAGGSGAAIGGAGGFGSSRLTYADTTASSLSANLSASGGYGAGLSSTGGAAGSATGELHLSSIGNIPVASVDAIGGNGGDGLGAGSIGIPGSTALLLPSSAVTTGTGKTVSLRAHQIGGGGGGAATGGRGADSHVMNVVSGAAPGGTLKLEQSATSGVGGRGNLGPAGDAGDASSSLTFIHSGEQKLEVTVNADAQQGGLVAGNYFGGVGGDATASGTVQDSQDVTLKVDAEAGEGSNGGDSSATASAISTGAGIVVVEAKSAGGSVTSLSGAPMPGTADLTAYGESQGGPVSVSGTANGGGAYFSPKSRVNGQAVSLANAVTGRSSGALTLTQTANAGSGAADPNAGSTGGNGGDAHSSIILPGGNPDGGALTATAWAAGGDSYFNPGTQTPGTPGSATAVCDLHNAGDARAKAQATPGRAGSQFSLPASSPSPANATARAISTVAFSQAYAEASHGGVPASSGTLSATSKTFGGVFSEVSATASAASTIQAAPSVGCRVGPRAITFGGSLMVSALPPSFGSLPANSAAALLNLSPLAEINLSSSFSSASTTLVMQPGGYSGPLKLALVSGSASSSTGLSAVHFTLARGGTTLIDQTFTDWSVLATYFNDQVIDLGQVSAAAGQPLTFSFTLGGSGTGFSTRMWLAAAQTPFSAWASGYGLANALTAGNDSDRDGESDLLEFAFDSDPLDGSKGSHLPVEILADRVRIQFTRRRADTQGLTYLLETSSTLAGAAAWAPMAPPWTVVTDDLSDTLESVTCEIPRDEAPESLFVRMKVDSE